MAEIDREADEFVGDIKETAGQLTGDDDLRNRGVAEQAQAKAQEMATEAKEAVSDSVERVKNQAEQAGDKAAEVAHDVHADDRRLWVTAAAAGVIVVVFLVRRAAKSRTVRRGAIIGATTGIAHALRP